MRKGLWWPRAVSHSLTEMIGQTAVPERSQSSLGTNKLQLLLVLVLVRPVQLDTSFRRIP